MKKIREEFFEQYIGEAFSDSPVKPEPRGYTLGNKEYLMRKINFAPIFVDKDYDGAEEFLKNEESELVVVVRLQSENNQGEFFDVEVSCVDDFRPLDRTEYWNGDTDLVSVKDMNGKTVKERDRGEDDKDKSLMVAARDEARDFITQEFRGVSDEFSYYWRKDQEDDGYPGPYWGPR